MKHYLIISFVSLLSFSFSTERTVDASLETSSVEMEKTIKEQAFDILQTKCNVCHEKKNKKKIFTPENMVGFSNNIYKQVFKWKRMPKGDDIKLTADEYETLRTWIYSLNQN